MENDIKTVLDIIESKKASYRKQAYADAGLSETQVAAAIDSLVKSGVLKRNKRGAVALNRENQCRRSAALERAAMNLNSNGFK